MNDDTKKLRELVRKLTPAQRDRLRQSAEVELLKRKLEQAIEEQHAEFGRSIGRLINERG